MATLTLISTVHEEVGKCNKFELCNLLVTIRPDVIFLEALDDTYTIYQQSNYKNYGVYHKKLEIAALQMYGADYEFHYEPVLDHGTSKSFEIKYDFISKNVEWRHRLRTFNHLAAQLGFPFLNSAKAIRLQEELRSFENMILQKSVLPDLHQIDNEQYERSILKNILSYSKTKVFRSAVLLCGVAHRKSIMNKLLELESKHGIDLSIEGLEYA